LEINIWYSVGREIHPLIFPTVSDLPLSVLRPAGFIALIFPATPG
jgi:hypothetical protein